MATRFCKVWERWYMLYLLYTVHVHTHTHFPVGSLPCAVRWGPPTQQLDGEQWCPRSSPAREHWGQHPPHTPGAAAWCRWPRPPLPALGAMRPSLCHALCTSSEGICYQYTLHGTLCVRRNIIWLYSVSYIVCTGWLHYPHGFKAGFTQKLFTGYFGSKRGYWYASQKGATVQACGTLCIGNVQLK